MPLFPVPAAGVRLATGRAVKVPALGTNPVRSARVFTSYFFSEAELGSCSLAMTEPRVDCMGEPFVPPPASPPAFTGGSLMMQEA